MPHNDILAKLKDAVRSVAANIQNYVSNPGDFSRNGKLPPDVLMEFLIGQGSRSTRNELIEAFSYNKDHPSAPALVQKRAKLNPDALRDVLYRFNQSLEPDHSNSNYRFFAADGSTFSFLSTLQFSSDVYFTDQGNSAKGAFGVHLTAFMDLDTNRYSAAVIQPVSQKDEYKAFSTIVDVHPLPVSAKAVFIADRGFCSYNNMAHVMQRGQFFLFRAKDIHSKGLLHHIVFPSDDEFDVSIQLVIVRRQSKKLSLPDGYVRFVNKDTSFDFIEYGSNGFFVLPLRIVRFKLPSGDCEALVTNLPSNDFPPDDLKKLYFRRWGIETSFRHLKYTIGLSKFHAKTASFVTQEIWGRLISYNFACAVMDCVRIPVTETKHSYKVSVSAAVLVCRKFILSLIAYFALDVLELLARELIPIRLNRSFPRLSTAHFRRPPYFLYRPS